MNVTQSNLVSREKKLKAEILQSEKAGVENVHPGEICEENSITSGEKNWRKKSHNFTFSLEKYLFPHPLYRILKEGTGKLSWKHIPRIWKIRHKFLTWQSIEHILYIVYLLTGLKSIKKIMEKEYSERFPRWNTHRWNYLHPSPPSPLGLLNIEKKY